MKKNILVLALIALAWFTVPRVYWAALLMLPLWPFLEDYQKARVFAVLSHPPQQTQMAIVANSPAATAVAPPATPADSPRQEAKAYEWPEMDQQESEDPWLWDRGSELTRVQPMLRAEPLPTIQVVAP